MQGPYNNYGNSWGFFQLGNAVRDKWLVILLAGEWRYKNCQMTCRQMGLFDPGGGTPKNFWRGCAAPVFDRIPLAKEILVENIPLAKEHFLIMSPFLHGFKEFQPQNSLFKRNFPNTNANLAPKCHFLGFFVKNIPLAKDFGRKIYPWLRNFCQKLHPWLRFAS